MIEYRFTLAHFSQGGTKKQFGRELNSLFRQAQMDIFHGKFIPLSTREFADEDEPARGEHAPVAADLQFVFLHLASEFLLEDRVKRRDENQCQERRNGQTSDNGNSQRGLRPIATHSKRHRQ